VTFSLLGQDLHETAEHAKKFFADTYGATGFQCEQPVNPDLRLRPTWQARKKNGYVLCINVQPGPFTETLYEFVIKAAQLGLPIKLWVAIAAGAVKESFSADLRRAREMGVGVVEMRADGSGHEYHRAVPLSLFALARTKLAAVPRVRREEVKNAEAIFLDGAPDQGCQAICQELESITRRFGEYTYDKGWWNMPGSAPKLQPRFFRTDSWAKLLEEMERRIDYTILKTKVPAFTKQHIVRARAFTDWRNVVSHKPRTLRQLQARDNKLRSILEVRRDLLVDWCVVARPLKLLG